jgi:signal recognition particle receptor subunit beta
MVFFNYATMQMAAKIVYYGPGLCGKTTNLHHIYAKTSPQSRGEMVSLETETDRTLFFDLLPIDVGVIGGFKTRLQLYTVPGQVFYNTTRKLVLKGVDGIVFVADSQAAMLDANRESFNNLRENLRDIGLALDDIPLVVQLNKRDLPALADGPTILKALDPAREFDSVEAVAYKGEGVFETLKLISKLTLRTLRRRMTGEEPVKPGAPRGEAASFRVKDDGVVPRTLAATPAPAKAIGTTAAHAPNFTGAAAATATLEESAQTALRAAPELPPERILDEPIEELTPDEELTVNDEIGAAAEIDTRTIAEEEGDEAPASTQYIPPPFVEEAMPEPEPLQLPVPEALQVVEEIPAAPVEEPQPVAEAAHEPEIEFSQSTKAAKSPDVKHVKVRSSVDVMAELEALRKRATAAPKRKEVTAADVMIPTPKQKREIHRTLSMQASPDAAARARSVRVTVSFDDEAGVVQTQEQTLELNDLADVRSLVVDLKIALE